MARPPHGAAASGRVWAHGCTKRRRSRAVPGRVGDCKQFYSFSSSVSFITHEAAAVTGSPGISRDVIAADVIARHAVLCRSD